MDNIPWSRPGRLLWDTYVAPVATRIYAEGQELFYDPNPDEIIGIDTQVWQFNFKFDPDNGEAFWQNEGTIYWLGLHHSADLDGDGDVDLTDLMPLMESPSLFGWKTSGVKQFMDDAVYTDVYTLGGNPHVAPESDATNEIWLPMTHPELGVSIDLAFVIDSSARKPYLPGDTDLDYDVDATDLATLGLNWDPSGTTKVWAQGNFDEVPAGDVDATDLANLGLNWSPGGYGIPEPLTMTMLGAGSLVLLRRRRRS